MEEVRAVKEELLRQQRNIIEQKLERAEQKRHHLLQTRVQKAHEERLKVYIFRVWDCKSFFFCMCGITKNI